MNLLLFRIPAEEVLRDEGDAARMAVVGTRLLAAGFKVVSEAADDADGLRRIMKELRPDMAFSSSARFREGDGFVHSAFEESRLDYVGSSPEAIALCLDKAELKERWKADCIETPSWAVARMAEPEGLALSAPIPGFPVILKPLAGGNSKGVSAASVQLDEASLERALPAFLASFGDCLIERYLGRYRDRREFTVSLIGHPLHGLLMPIEVRVPETRDFPLVTTTDKDRNRTIITTISDEALRESLMDFAARAFVSAGVRDYGRMDIILAGGELHAIEINGQPMMPDPWFRECAAGLGLGENFVEAVFLAALVRSPARREQAREWMPPYFSKLPAQARASMEILAAAGSS